MGYTQCWPVSMQNPSESKLVLSENNWRGPVSSTGGASFVNKNMKMLNNTVYAMNYMIIF